MWIMRSVLSFLERHDRCNTFVLVSKEDPPIRESERVSLGSQAEKPVFNLPDPRRAEELC
jgi:hypothetical protein